MCRLSLMKWTNNQPCNRAQLIRQYCVDGSRINPRYIESAQLQTNTHTHTRNEKNLLIIICARRKHLDVP